MSEKINPCPNPKCGGKNAPIIERTPSHLWVYCSWCNVTGPISNTESAAIAAWNSISMVWHPAETAPKDGTLIQATMRTAKWVHVLWIERSPDAVEGEESGWFCPESGVEYWESDLLGWRSIPPLPEGR